MPAWSKVIELILCAGTALVIGSSQAASQSEYIRSESFWPIHVSQDELRVIISKVHNLLADLNGPADEWTNETLALKDQSRGIELKKDFSKIQFDAMQFIATEITYRYMNSNSPISSVVIGLHDGHRWMEVSGESPQQVDAIAALIRSELSNFETYFGGETPRGIIQMFIIVGCLFGTLLLSATGSWLHIAAGVGTTAAVFTFLYIAPLDIWFAGAVVFPGPTSVWQRNAGAIGALGLLLPIMISAAEWARRALANRSRAPAQIAPSSALDTNEQATIDKNTK